MVGGLRPTDFLGAGPFGVSWGCGDVEDDLVRCCGPNETPVMERNFTAEGTAAKDSTHTHKTATW